jgi:hypothetical protein
MDKKTPIIVLLLIFTMGCNSLAISTAVRGVKSKHKSLSKSIDHRGIVHAEGKRFAGRISNQSAALSRSVITHFHNLILLKEYHDAYRIFSDELKEKIPYEAFLDGIKKLDEDYGEELTFKIIKDPLTEIFIIDKQSFFKDAHMYYDTVISSYASRRRKNVIFKFGVTRASSNELRICLYGYQLPEQAGDIEYDAIPHKESIEDAELQRSIERFEIIEVEK